MLWSINTEGGYAYSDNLDADLRTYVQPGCKFRQLCDAKSALGLGAGESYHWNIYSDTSDDGTIGSTGIAENEEMPMDDVTISQGTVTIGEFGRGVPYTGLLDDLSEQPVKEIIRKSLKNHAIKSIDRAAGTKFFDSPLRVVPTAGTNTSAVTLTTNGTATLTNNIAMGKEHVKSIVDTMKERNIPSYGHGDYYALAWPTTYRTFKNNLETIHQYTDTGLGLIMEGEQGRYESTRFIEQTNMPKSTPSTATAAAWTNGLSDWVVFMGEDTVTEAISIEEEIRGKLATDFGRSRAVAWYALLGFSLVQTLASQARVVIWDSAA